MCAAFDVENCVFVRGTCFVVANSPRLGSLSEIYAEIVISAHGYPNGILQLSNDSVHVRSSYVGPLVYVSRTDGLLGQVRCQLLYLMNELLSLAGFKISLVCVMSVCLSS